MLLVGSRGESNAYWGPKIIEQDLVLSPADSARTAQSLRVNDNGTLTVTTECRPPKRRSLALGILKEMVGLD